MRKILICVLVVFWGAFAMPSLAQVSNMSLSNGNAVQVLKGQYDFNNYAPSEQVADPEQVACEVNQLVSADSLQSYLTQLLTYGNRNTWSDTVSSQTGIGAARRWIKQKFDAFSAQNENRLLTGYLSFDINNNTCGNLSGTKNVVGVLPGADTSDASIVLIMGHMDSRCEGRCDTACAAPGADDNGSGTVLVMELARVMSRYTFEHTVVFMATTGEEQGLLGAEAFADYCVQENIGVKAVLNNDVVGGIICGQTASPPGCNPAGAIDSTRLRIYTNPLSRRNPMQGYARAIRTLYQEKMKSNLAVPMDLELINQEDRIGRGGDHIPFRENDFRNLRFSSAHEHGNGNPAMAGYQDRQHTTNDILGLDTDGDMVVDSFFVDFNYLSRNAVINGASAAFMANGPDVPEFTVVNNSNEVRIDIDAANGASEYRVGVKGFGGALFDSVYRFNGSSFVIPDLQSGSEYYIGVAGIDENGLMGAYTQDERVIAQSSTVSGPTDPLPYGINCAVIGLPAWQVRAEKRPALELLPPRPNPFREASDLVVLVREELPWTPAQLKVVNAQGKLIHQIEVALERGANLVRYRHQAGPGLYYYYLEAEGYRSPAQKMLIE